MANYMFLFRGGMAATSPPASTRSFGRRVRPFAEAAKKFGVRVFPYCEVGSVAGGF